MKKMTKYLFGCIVTIIFILSACENSLKVTGNNSVVKYCGDSSLVLSVNQIRAISGDSIIVDLEIENKCTDSVIIMRDYTKPRFYFPVGSIQSNSIQSMPLYPSIDWEASTKGAKETYIANRCNPLIRNHNILVIGPNESKIVSYNLKSLGYNGFQGNIKYDFFVAFNVSNQIKSYCPFIWAGFTKSNTYSFTVSNNKAIE